MTEMQVTYSVGASSTCFSDDRLCDPTRAAVNNFLQAVDFVTAGPIEESIDGRLTVDQLRSILDEGELTDSVTFDVVNNQHEEAIRTLLKPSFGALAALSVGPGMPRDWPWAHDVRQHLARRHPEVYDALFVKNPPGTRTQVMERVRGSLQNLAAVLEGTSPPSVSSSRREATGLPYERREQFVVLSHGEIRTQPEIQPALAREVGGGFNYCDATDRLDKVLAYPYYAARIQAMLRPCMSDLIKGEEPPTELPASTQITPSCKNAQAKALRYVADRI